MQDASGGTTATRLPRLAILQLRGLEHFLPDLAAGLAASGVVEVQVFTIRSPADLQDALDWTDRPATDAVWFEFCWPPFPDLIARTDFAGRRVIVRVHRIEAYETPHVARCPWPKVDDLVTVSQDMARLVREAAPQLERMTRLRVIHNGVQLGRFAPAEAPPDPFRIGWCGTMIARKNPTLALEVLARLLAEDPRWRLHIVAGQGDRLTQDAVLHLVPRMRLGGAVRYDGTLPAAEMPAWHARNAVLLSTSLHESFGYAIAEAAAVGCDLAVLEHRGVEEFWPEAVRFATADEAVRLIRAARPQRWRGLVEARYGLDRQVAAVLALLRDRPAAGLPGGALPGFGARNPEPRHPGTREPDPGQAAPGIPPAGTGEPDRSAPAALAAPTAPATAPQAAGFSSAGYWEQRYRHGASSGAGSYGQLAAFKAAFINGFARLNAVRDVLELGCGDGHQLGLFDLPRYSGIDVSSTVLARCRAAYAGRPGCGFFHSSELDGLPEHDLCLSLDVIYHLVEDAVFETYIDGLFGKAGRFVIVYSSNVDAAWTSPHVRHRRFTDAVAQRHPAWRLAACVPNLYPFRPEAQDRTSFAEFFVFATPGEDCIVPTPARPKPGFG